MKHYKFLNLVKGKIKSAHGNCVWEVGQWKTEEDIDICSKGFHCSDTILDALSYVKGEVLSVVETKGKNIKQNDKSVWESMRLVKAYEWTKNDSVSLSIFSAELCLKNFEKLYPNDNRPRLAIEATKEYLKNPTEENGSAAWSAARSAESAAESARSAARSAWSAAESARSAESAAWYAARSAESAARSAARSAAIKKINSKINKWLVFHLKEMKEYENK